MILAGLTALAIAVRLYHLGYESLNGGDEPYMLALSQRPFGEMFELFGYEANATIYSVILWPLVRLSESEELVRSPAFFFGVLAVPAMWWSGRELVDERAGLIAAALIAVNPMAIAFSQFARPFTLVIALSCVSFASLSVALRDGRRRWWVIYAVALVGLGYANAVAPFILLAAQALVVFVHARTQVRAWLLAVLGFLLASVPLFVALAVARSRRDPLYWLDAPGPGALYNTAEEFTGGSSGSAAVLALTLLVVVGLVAWVALGERRDTPVERPAGGWLGIPPMVTAWALVPIPVLFVVSQITPLFREAYVIGVLPGILLAVAVLLGRLTPWQRWAGLGLLLALAVSASAIQTSKHVGETWESALGWIGDERESGDRVLVDIISVFPVFGYYDERYQAANGELIVLEWGEYPLPADIVPLDDPGGYTGPTGPPTPEMIRGLASGDDRLFVVLAEYVERLQGDIPNGEALDWARRRCDVVERPEVKIDVYLISGCPPS